MGELPENNQGKGTTYATYLDNLEVTSAVHSKVTGLVLVDKGGFEGHVSVALAYLSLITQFILSLPRCIHVNYVNMSIILSSPKLQIEDTISETTVVHWLKELGFKLSHIQKGVYVNRHKQPNEVEAHKEFFDYLETHVFPCVFYMFYLYLFIDIANIRYCYKYEGNNMETGVLPDLKPGKKIYYPIFHNECCIHANDQCT